MSYFKERIPALIEKYKKNIDYLESIIEANGEDLLEDEQDEDGPKGLGLGNEKAVNIIKAKKEARLELTANYFAFNRYPMSVCSFMVLCIYVRLEFPIV